MSAFSEHVRAELDKHPRSYPPCPGCERTLDPIRAHLSYKTDTGEVTDGVCDDCMPMLSAVDDVLQAHRSVGPKGARQFSWTDLGAVWRRCAHKQAFEAAFRLGASATELAAILTTESP